MMDVVLKSGDKINTKELSRALACPVVEISALKSNGVMEAAQAAIHAAQNGKTVPQHSFSGTVEHALAHIEEAAVHDMPLEQQRWYAIKIFERDEKVLEQLKLSEDRLAHIESDIRFVEEKLDDDAESIITNERYVYIASILQGVYQRKSAGRLSASDRIDRVVTNRLLALPIFALVMFLVYFLSITTVGTWATDWANEGLFGKGWHLSGAASYEEAVEAYAPYAAHIAAFEAAARQAGLSPEDEAAMAALPAVTTLMHDDAGRPVGDITTSYLDYAQALDVEEPDPAAFGTWVPGIPVLVEGWMRDANVAPWLSGLILDGIVAGVGAVLGFVPQMLMLFLLLAFLESCGYMTRIAFIMDRIFRRFGLSGKSFIPMLIGTGCSVPGIMASRTIENERDRRMTIITTSFMPCGAKLPIIALIAGAMFSNAGWVAASAYFVGIAAIVVSGIMLKKTRIFMGDPAPFVMELPAYHWPTLRNLLSSTWERGWSFIKKAGSVILLSSIIIWFFSAFGWEEGRFGLVDMEHSILAGIGGAVAIIFGPLGWGTWQAAVATITGQIAKKNVVGTFGVLFGGFEEVSQSGWQVWQNMRAAFTPLSAYSFLLFNLLCAPCVAAVGAIRREMNDLKWTGFAVLYQTGLAYATSLIVYQLGMLLSGSPSTPGVIVALALLASMLYLLLRPAGDTDLRAKTAGAR
jgi:ferrous iron transport protein B